jgi:hypothetical protein
VNTHKIRVIERSFSDPRQAPSLAVYLMLPVARRPA